MDREPIAYCEECKCDLYEGDTVYKVLYSGKVYCEDCILKDVLEDVY